MTVRHKLADPTAATTAGRSDSRTGGRTDSGTGGGTGGRTGGGTGSRTSGGTDSGTSGGTDSRTSGGTSVTGSGRGSGEGAYVLRPDARVSPRPVSRGLAGLVARVQRVAWPLWTEPGPHIHREVVELCRLQAARGLTVLSWLALGGEPPGEPELEWLLATSRLAGPRQRRMYDAAERLPDPVRAQVVANWTWSLTTAYGGQVTASFLASGAYPEDGYAAAHATVALLRLWERRPETRQPLAAAWAATRTPADWCKAAELRAAYGAEVPMFTYPGAPPPSRTTVRPWVGRLLGLGRA